MELPGTIWIVFFILLGSIIAEVFFPKKVREGFALIGAIDSSENNFFASFAPRRGDVGPTKEEKNFTANLRYFHDYVDVQRFGFKHDYCRLVIPNGVEANSYFACALAGTLGPSTSYKTKSLSEGLELSRDDYMRDIYNENRYAYCRILRGNDNTFQPLCLRAKEFGFSDKNEIDSNPPADIRELLDFYLGCVGWLRLFDDMLDYTKNITVATVGNISIAETPNVSITQGISFNGVDQFLRISDNPDLTLGSKISLRNIRAVSVWVYFDAFTNNAHIFDFGNGPNNGNFYMGILGKGDEIASDNVIREDATLPDYPSGPHPCKETTPKNLMKSSSANVNEFECKMFDVVPRKMEPSNSLPQTHTVGATKATLLYEIWDGKQRRMRVKINSVIPLKKWTHITVSAITNDSLRPDLRFSVNGEEVYIQPSGYLPQSSSTTNNYLGKSNWSNQTSQYELKDELFSGKIFDFRLYSSVVSPEKIGRMVRWGKLKLGVEGM